MCFRASLFTCGQVLYGSEAITSGQPHPSTLIDVHRYASAPPVKPDPEDGAIIGYDIHFPYKERLTISLDQYLVPRF